MAENKYLTNGQEITLRNLFKEQADKCIEDAKKDIPSNEELDRQIEEAYKIEETNIKHAKEIANYRLPIRISKGKLVVREELIEDWINFVNQYSIKEISYNFEIEAILKYLVMIDEGIYKISEIANKFANEFQNLNSASTIFILINIEKYSKVKVPFYSIVNETIKARIHQIKDEKVLEITDTLVRKGIPLRDAQTLAETKIAKLYENGHEIAELMSFANGNREGVDTLGNWIFMREINTPSNRHMVVIFKVNREDTMRYIIDKDTNIALVTNELGTYKTKAAMNVETSICEDLNTPSTIEAIDIIITDIAVIGVSHDRSYEIAKEMIELVSPVNEETATLNLEEIYNQELPKLKKNYE